MKVNAMVKILFVISILVSVWGVWWWIVTSEARDFHAEFNVQPPQSETERSTLRSQVVARLIELSKEYRDLEKDTKINKDIQDRLSERNVTPQGVMAQADLSREIVLTKAKMRLVYEKWGSACQAALAYYREEVRVLECPLIVTVKLLD